MAIKRQRVASIDIGSNAMRLLIAEECGGKLVALEHDRGAVRLGADVFENGILSEDTMSRAIEVIKGFKKKIDAANVSSMRAVATSAMREATNGADLCQRVAKETGVQLEIINGEEEARLVYLAVSENVTFSKGIDVLVDIGGGSVEITIVRDGSILFSESVKLGTVRLIQLFDSGEITAATFQRLVHEYSQTIKTKLLEQLGEEAVERCIGTGGNLGTFLELRHQIFGKLGDSLEISELEGILEKLQELSVQERIEKFGMRADRADVIVPAAIVMLHVLKASQASTLLVPGVGVKEGVIYELLRGDHEKTPQFSGPKVREAALELGRKYNFDERHALSVARLAQSVFEQTRELHELDEQAAKLLDLGALLHDIGHFVSSQGHHKHSYYLIESAFLPGLTKREKLMVACIARYHRKRFPQESHIGFSELTLEEREVVLPLAAILRLVDGLDRDHRQLVQNVKLVFDAPSSDSLGSVGLVIEGQGDLLLDRWSVKLKSDLFSHVFKRNIEILELEEGSAYPSKA